MVNARAGLLGAVSRQSRNTVKSGGNTAAPKKTKKPKAPKAEKKKSKKHERVETPEEQRARNELYLLAKQMAGGHSLDKIDFEKLDKKLDKMQRDEQSDEEDSEDDDESAGSTTTEEDRAHQKTLKRYQVDLADYQRQYSNADENPIYFEQYQPTMYKCFDGVEITEWKFPVSETLNRLFKYTNEIMKSYTPPTADHLPPMLTQSPFLRNTSQYTNFCFNPIQAMRAWGLLHGIAQNKTAHELKVFIDSYIKNVPATPYSKDASERHSRREVNNDLLALHYDAEEVFDGCVRLFTELPRHLPHNNNVRRKSSVFYGGKSQRAAIQHHCFATDSDGFYSCYRINEEVSLSTHGAVRFVVPENSAPNWRASIALVSAMECTFYWKTTEEKPKIINNYRFVDGNGLVSLCTVISAKADILGGVATGSAPAVYRLMSEVPEIALIILIEDPAKANEPKSLPSNILEIVQQSVSWPLRRDHHVYLPKCTTSVPISLYDHSKHHGLDRLFSSEKSELRHLKMSKFDAQGPTQYLTLFDHYHKTVFDICPGRKDESEKKKNMEFDQLAPERAHQCIEQSSAKLFGEYQSYSNDSQELLFTYFEEHLDRSPDSVKFVDASTVFHTPTETDSFDLGKPFYYVMTRKFDAEEMIVCAGYFNNTVWVKPPE